MRKYFTALVALLLITVTAAAQGAKENVPVRNVIFMIGDGMGIAQLQLAMLNSPTPLAMTRAQHTGLQYTYSANNRVTDSAAAGTALACGVKTNNGRLGLDPEGNRLRNIMEVARQGGLATGIVVTKDITDATPAAFSAHVPNRGMAAEIAQEQLRCGIDVLVGGGRANFEERPDKANFSDSLRANGYKVIYTLDELKAIERGKAVGLLAEGHMKTMAAGRGSYLPEATARVLDILKNNSKKGFLIMVEGSQIDSRGHANDAEGVMGETLDFDKAVGAAFDFADRNPGTLVIVTADHETGGLTLPSGKDDFMLGDQGVKTRFSTGGHTAIMVPVYTYGAGAGTFPAFMDNTEIPRKLASLLGFQW